MFTVADISTDAKRILANCDDSTPLNRLNYAVEQLANESDWDPLVGVVDIATTSTDQRLVTLPREVETVLQLSFDSNPSSVRNRFFTFHLNGPGDTEMGSCSYIWDDKGDYPTLEDLTVPTRLSIFAEDAADASVDVFAYGYDANNRWLRTQSGGVWYDGIPVPVYTDGSLPPATPTISRITRIRKGESDGYMRLRGYAVGGTTATLLGDYAPTELEPSYRRIRLNQAATTVRIIFRRNVFRLTSLTDLIPLHSPFALLMALKGLQKMEDDQLDEGEKYFQKAVSALVKEQLSRNPVTTPELQVRGPLVFTKHNRLE
jgi:hypothetical protein